MGVGGAVSAIKKTKAKRSGGGKYIYDTALCS